MSRFHRRTGLVGCPQGWHKKATPVGTRPSPFKDDNVPRCHRQQDTRHVPTRFAAGFCGGRWRGGGLAPWGRGPRCPLPLPRPPGPPSPCAVAPRRSRFRSVARPASPLPSQLVTCWLPSLCRVAVMFGPSICVYALLVGAGLSCFLVGSLFVRCRPLLGGVRWAARGGVNMCHAVWCVPVRMGIVLARSFFIAHAAPTHQTAMRRAFAAGFCGGRWRGGVNMCHAVWCVPVRMGIVLARSFFIAHAAPTHQTAMRRAFAAGFCGGRWRGGVNMCHAVWCVPVRMGIVLARSFFIAHAAPTHQTAMRRAMRRTQPVRPRPHILGPQFPQNLPVTGQGLR